MVHEMYFSLSANQLLESRGGHRLGSLEGKAEGPVPDQRGGHAEGTGHSEQHSVVVHLLHAVVLKENKWLIIQCW